MNKLYYYYFKLFLSSKNGLTFGFIFVLIGAYITKYKIFKINEKLLLIFSIFMLFVEANILRFLNVSKDNNMYVSLIFVDFFLMLFLLKINLNENKIYKYLREMSLYIYCSHPLFIYIISKLLNIVFNVKEINNLILFFLTFIISLLFSLLVINIKKFMNQKENINFNISKI